jgi:hypothetical protein
LIPAVSRQILFACTTTLVATVAENLMNVNSLMIGKVLADSQGALGI